MSRQDVAIIGAGLSGMSAAAILQRRGYDTVVIEAHALPGGCAGFYRRRGFSFDVGATTLVDFEPGGVGGHLLAELELSMELEPLPGYKAWLPDRTITLYRDEKAWHRERERLGRNANHKRFWRILDQVAESFWSISRHGGRLPIAGMNDVLRAFKSLRLRDIPRLRYLNWTAQDLLVHCGLEGNDALRGLFAMIVEDTAHTTLDRAPLVHAALGATMRGAGLSRARGGMRGFWRRFIERYEELGGTLCRDHRALRIEREASGFVVHTSRGSKHVRQVVSSLPIEATYAIGPPCVQESLRRYVDRDRTARGGALAVFLGVPEHEVKDQDFTHHQLMHDCAAPLGRGNNMFISISSPGDVDSAPAGMRSVMITTHCELDDWQGLDSCQYERKKKAECERLIRLANRAFPRLGRSAKVCEFATPRTYARFTRRPLGAVGGVRFDPSRAMQRAVPQCIGLPGFYLTGDTTWPGVGTVACVISGRAAADLAMARCAPQYSISAPSARTPLSAGSNTRRCQERAFRPTV